MVLLYRELEWSCFAGLVVMIALMPINTKVARTQQKYTRNTMKARDKRVNLLSEMLQAIRCPQSASLALILLTPAHSPAPVCCCLCQSYIYLSCPSSCYYFCSLFVLLLLLCFSVTTSGCLGSFFIQLPSLFRFVLRSPILFGPLSSDWLCASGQSGCTHGSSH